MANMATAKRSAKKSDKKLRLLFTCIGRRVELLRAFQAAAKSLRIDLEIHGADATWLAPGMHCVDKGHIVPRISSGEYIDALLQVVRKSKIDLLIPLIDNELLLIAQSVDRFAEIGCRAIISSERVVRTCRDKLAMFEALRQALIDTPETWTWEQAMRRQRHTFPYYLKPRGGSAGVGNFVISNRDELNTFGLRVQDAIVQEFVEGVEHTMDVYAGFDGIPRIAVPRRRIEVRTGEVSKGVTVKDPAIMNIGIQVAKMLGECRGVVTVQCMVTPSGLIRVIEVNPRFGGGAPLAIQAGADFPKWILMEHLGRKFRINPNSFRHDLLMLRMDDSVFVPNASKYA